MSQRIKKTRDNDTVQFIYCPRCGAKTDVEIQHDTVLIHFPLLCPKCQEKSLIDVVQFKMALSKEYE